MDTNTRLHELERKVHNLEQQLAELRSERIKSQPVQTPPAPYTTTTTNQPLQAAAPTRQIPPATPRPKTDWEHLIARVWLPRIFIVVFLLGVLWGFTAAVSAGIITEPVRCFLGFIAAGLMFWQGEAQISRHRQALGQVLLGGSIAVLMLSVFASHMLYEFLPSWLAFILYVISIGLGVFASVRHRSQALMIIIMIGGYILPFLVESTKPNPWFFVGYETIFSITMTLLAVRYSFKGAFYTAIGLLHLPLLISYAVINWRNAEYAFAAAILLQHATLYVLSIFRLGLHKMEQSITLLSGFAFMSLWMLGLFQDDEPFVYQTIMAGWSILYSLTALRFILQKKEAALYVSVATFGWFVWLTDLLNAGNWSASLLIEGMLALILGLKLNSKLQQLTGSAVYVIGTYSVLLQPIYNIISVETLAWVTLLVTIGLLYTVIRNMHNTNQYKHYQNGLLWADAILLLIFLTQITNVWTDRFPGDIQHLILSAVWAVYAIAVIVFGLIAEKPKVRLAGILFLFITLLKVIFIDLPDVSTVVRAILFLGLGSVGIGISRLFYKRNKGN